jgi:hypothetical protein
MTTYRGIGGIAPPFLTSELDAVEWSASCPGCFTPGKEPSVPGRLHSRSGSDGEEKYFCPCKELDSGRPARNFVTILTELPWPVYFAANDGPARRL